MTRVRALLTSALCLVPFALSSSQAPQRDVPVRPVGTASIAGTIMTDEDTSRPIRRAVVTLTGAELRPNRVTITDDAGRFGFAALPAGRFTLSATKAPYVNTAYGQKRPGRGSGIPISIVDGQPLSGITVKMPRGAVVTGTIFDDAGQPSSGTQVSVLEYRTVNGERTLQTSPGSIASAGPLGGTDDRGVYRIYGLPPGEYVIAASPSPFASILQGGELRQVTSAEMQWARRQLAPTNATGFAAGAGSGSSAIAPPAGQPLGYAPVYYPGTSDAAGAVMVTLARGQERTGVGFALGLVPTAKVEGTIVGVDGRPPSNVQISFASKSGGGVGLRVVSSTSFSRPGQDGKFSIPNLTPGQYTIVARAASPRTAAPAGPPTAGRGGPAPPAQTLWAMTDVSVNGQDTTGLVLNLQEGMTVSGKVTFDAATLTPPQDMSAVRVVLAAVQTGQGAPISVPIVNANADGTFDVEGVTPGRYRLTASIAPPPGAPAGTTWTVKSSMVNGRDIADVPMEIKPNENIAAAVVTLTDKGAQVTGTVIDAAGRPTPEYSVLVFSTDKASWLQGSRRLRPPARPATDGRFTISGLPPGEYYVAALTEVDTADLYDAAYLELIAANAIKIALAEGEKKTQDLKLAGSQP